MRCFPEYKRWAPLWLAPHSTDRPLHESLALRHCPGHSCIERAVAVHCSQLDNQPKKYKEGFLRTGHEAVSQGAEREEELWYLPGKSGTPTGSSRHWSSFSTCASWCSQWLPEQKEASPVFSKQLPGMSRTLTLGGRKASWESALSTEQVLLVPHGGQAHVNSGWAMDLTCPKTPNNSQHHLISIWYWYCFRILVVSVVYSCSGEWTREQSPS